MSAVHALNGYREAQIINKRRELRRNLFTSLFTMVKQALVRLSLVDWFNDPFFWELYEAQRDGGNAAAMDHLIEKWGR